MSLRDELLAKLNPVMSAMDTFRVVAQSHGGSDQWIQSAYENMIRELQTLLATEESKRLAEMSGLLRDVLTFLEEGITDGNALVERLRGSLGLLDLPSDSGAE